MKTTRYDKRAKVLKAMAHPSRLAMLEELADGERCVCDLQKIVGSDISTVSKHLSLMKAAGLVEDRKAGLWVHYRLRVPCVLQFMDCIEAVVDGREAATARMTCSRP
jgi:ArsR family transcriptional regulator